MLVLSRAEFQSITLIVPGHLLVSGEDMKLEVGVTQIREHQVRLGFAAPREVSIVRNELLEVRR